MSKMSYAHTPHKIPMDHRLLHQSLDSLAEQHPDTEAIILYDMEKKRSAMTYGEYRDRSMCLATSLLELGLSRGQRVVLMGRNSLRFVVFLMALHRIGANVILVGPGSLTSDKVNLLKRIKYTAIAFDPEMNEAQTQQLMRGIEELVNHNQVEKEAIQTLVTLGDLESGLRVFKKGKLHTYDSLLKRGQSQDIEKLLKAQAEVQFDDHIMASFTSGSTGESKLVQRIIHGWVNMFDTSQIAFKRIPRMKLYFDRPMVWAAETILSTICSNTTIVCVPTEMALSDQTNEAVFEIVQREKCITCFLSVPLMRKLLKESLHLKYDLSYIKLFVLVGQRFPRSLIIDVCGALPLAKAYLMYGLTETLLVSGSIFSKEGANQEDYGKMLIDPGVEVKIVDGHNKLVSRGTVGEICTRSPYVFLEYLGNAEATKEVKSSTGWLYTGDLGIMDDMGRIAVVGRKKEIIKRATVKIFPAEIEKVIFQHPDVADVVVIGVPHQQLHEEICACVVLDHCTATAPPSSETRLAVLEDWCELQWPPGPDGLSLKPKYFVLMENFPVMNTGKIDGRAIKQAAMEKLGVKTEEN